VIIGQVLGSLWASQQDPGFDGQALKLVMPQEGITLLVVDPLGARVGDTVLVVYEGSSSRLCLGSDSTPAEAVIVGIVDRMDVAGG